MDVEAALARVERLDRRLVDLADKREAAIVDAYKAGASLGQIAARSAFTTEGVRRLLIRRKVDIRPPHVR